MKNIISNAIHAMPGGGTMAIRTARERFRDLPYITVRISDTGKGIPADRLEMIFEPFSAADEAGSPTRLGLPISKKILEGHGGFIAVESTLGKGSTFSLYVPLQAILRKPIHLNEPSLDREESPGEETSCCENCSSPQFF